MHIIIHQPENMSSLRFSFSKHRTNTKIERVAHYFVFLLLKYFYHTLFIKAYFLIVILLKVGPRLTDLRLINVFVNQTNNKI